MAGVGEKEWAFKTTFTASSDELKAPNADLVFDGLDTFAAVTLVRLDTSTLDLLDLHTPQNGVKILEYASVGTRP